jgi:hypothetical protein
VRAERQTREFLGHDNIANAESCVLHATKITGLTLDLAAERVHFTAQPRLLYQSSFDRLKGAHHGGVIAAESSGYLWE